MLPDHVHKISYDSTDFYSLGSYTDGHGLAPGTWLPWAGQPPRRLDTGTVYASKDFFDPVRRRRIMWGVCRHISSHDISLECFGDARFLRFCLSQTSQAFQADQGHLVPL